MYVFFLHELIIFKLSQPEICDLQHTIVKENILWFKISVQYFMLMNVFHASENLYEQIHALVNIWFFLRYIRQQSALITELQHKKNHTSGLEDLVDFNNIGVLESPHEIDFVGDKFLDLFDADHMQIQEFKSIDNSIFFRLKYLSKRSLPQYFIDFISIYSC